MKRLLSFALCLTLFMGMFGCGGGGGSSSDGEEPIADPVSVTGQFVDSFVAGLGYECSSGKSGTTNANGEFSCLEGDTIDFYLGKYFLGSSAVKVKITPVDLYPDNEVAVINVAQLLQTLDENNDPSDGIVIPNNFTALDTVAITPEDETFETDVEVKLGTALVEEIDAKAHLDIELTGKAPFAFAYLQWRTYEDPANDKLRGWLTLPEGMTPEDVADITLEDSFGVEIAGFISFRGSPDNYLMYDCRFGDCTSKIKGDYGYSLDLPEDTLEGTYTYILTTTSGDVYQKSVVYQGQIGLPVVASADIVPQWNADGSLTIEWLNPTSDPDWSRVDQVRVNVTPGTGIAETIIVKLKPSQTSNIIIPSSVVNSVFDEIDSSWIKVTIHTRAYDDNDNYARGLSNSVQLRSEIYPIKFIPINEVGTRASNHRLPDAYAGVDFLTIDADITTDRNAVTFTYETRADFQNATTGYFVLGMWFDRNGNDELDDDNFNSTSVDAMLGIQQNLSSHLSGCSASPTFAAVQEGNFVSVTVPWTDLNSCGISQDTPVRFWGHYGDNITGKTAQFPNTY